MRSRNHPARKGLIITLITALIMSMVSSIVMPVPQALADETPANVAAPNQEFRIVGANGDNINITGYSNNDPINVWFTQGLTNERWRLDSSDGQNYKLVNMTTKKLLSPKDWNLAGESVLYEDASREEQQWQFIATDPLNEEGFVRYKIVNKTDPSKALTLDAEARRVRIETYQGLETQKWKLVSDGTPAFPGAEGGGMYTTGGRGGDVYEVTTLADSGPGSLREGVSQSNTTIVFRVGGTIHLQSPLKITGSNLTIAGQTAPGEGITVSDYATYFEADNLIVRYMRFRLGDRYPSEDDAFGGRYHKNIIIDHCSFSWSVDEVLSMYVNENTTVQWSIASESMLMTSHQKGRHGYAGIWGGNNATFHHNLIAHNVSRNPRFAGSPNFPLDMYNNVIYNWGFFSVYGGEQGRYNLRDNYYKYGPNTYHSVRDMVFLDVSQDTRLFVGGNYMYGSPEVTADNWKGVGALANPESKLSTPVTMPQPAAPEAAEAAYEHVLAQAGAILPRRDAIDARVVQDVMNGTGRHINSQKEVGGYLEFAQTVSTLADDDHDGMPNEWETAKGLNPNDASDRNGTDSSGYTNLELYLNGITGNGSANPAAAIVSPADNTVVSEGANVDIQAAVSDSDGTVAKVEFYAGDVKLGEDTAAPFSFTWQNVQDGTYFLTVRAIDNTGTATQSSSAAIHVNKPGSTAPWIAQDIGMPGIAGHTQLGAAATDVTVKSAGDIDGRTDNFHYAYQTLTGNGEIVARVDSITATDDGAEAGVMIRENLGPSSKFRALLIPYVKYGKKSVVMTRTSEGGTVTRVEPEDFINTPYWVKLVRLGNQFTSLISSNGTDWSVIDSSTLPMADTVYVGLAADASKMDNDVNKYNASVFSHAEVRTLDPEFPPAPAGVMATPGDKSVSLSWNAVAVAAGYDVYRSELPGGPYTEIADGITGTTYTDANLIPGKAYFYVVTAGNAKGTSFNSAEVSAVPEGETETVYYVNDDFESAANESTPDGYTFTPVPQDADHKVVVTNVPAETAGNTSGKALIMYDNAAGSTELIRRFAPQTGKFVLEVDVTSAGWPGTATVLNLQDDAGSKTALSLQLRKPTLPAAEANYTLVYKKNGADYKLIDPPVNNQWYNLKIVTNVAAQTADIYVNNTLVENDAPLQADVRTVGIGRISAKTPGTGKGTIYYDNLKVYVEPVETPKGLTATPGNAKVQLNWSAAEGASTYSVKRSTTDGGPYETVASGLADVSYIDESVVNDTTYYYVVTATGATGESGASNQVAVTPSLAAVKPEAPAGLTAVPRSAQADLAWQSVDNAISYTVKRSTTPQGPFTAVASNITATFYRDGGLDNGVTYYYAVSATSIGGEGADSAAASVAPYRHLATPSVSARPVPNGAQLEWEPVSGAEAYIVKRAARADGPYTVIAESISGGTYEDSGLVNGSPYYYKVAAVNDATSSLDSAAVGVRPSAGDGTPVSPAGLTAVPDNASIAVSWTGVPGAASYAVKRSESPDGAFTEVAGGLTGTSFTDNGLENGKAYYYTVTASNEAGEGPSSPIVREVPAPVLTVAADGSGQFAKVQDAINAVPANSAIPTIIKIKNGTYREKLDLSSAKVKVRMIGESREDTVLVYGDAASTPDANGNPLGTSGSYSFRVQASDFTAEHLTIQNDAGISAGQAVALYANADRLMLRDVSLLGHQDTLYANNGRHYYVDSYIAGTVDFIFGNAAAVFENSTIHSLGGGYVTAASTAAGKPGYVFWNSRITSEPGISGVALGRPWRGDANVVYVNSYLGEHIAPTGWNNWGNVNNEKTARYGEFASYGPGANPKSRYSWAKQLTAEEAAQYAPAVVLGGSDGWNPFAQAAMAEGSRELASLTVNGEPVPDFVSSKTQYTVEVPDSSAVPVVAASALSASTLVEVEQAAAIPGTAIVRVTAQDGGERSYTVKFEADSRDQQAPVTSDNAPAGWVNQHVTVTLKAADEQSGVANTYYSLDGGAFRTGNQVEIMTEGQHTLTYYSVDLAGNAEAPRAVRINVDRTAPSVAVSVYGQVYGSSVQVQDYEPITVNVQATDLLSGVKGQSIRVDGKPYEPGSSLNWAGQLGKHRIEVSVTDNAGNTTTKELTVNVITSVESIRQLIARFSQSGELDGPLQGQLSNRLDQAADQWSKGHSKQAMKHMQDFLKHLNGDGQLQHISAYARKVLQADADAVIEMWGKSDR
ncbi:pectinesterase family protein [Paenibacillus chartarius]|uniref:Pectinesterase family protein n=1 Tax=Paenibacillus chartarius TaxID=747481 RepID=A0ABV6DT44_9BACL